MSPRDRFRIQDNTAIFLRLKPAQTQQCICFEPLYIIGSKFYDLFSSSHRLFPMQTQLVAFEMTMAQIFYKQDQRAV